MHGIQPDGHFTGIVYGAHEPRWAGDPVSGEGARVNGGRFNKRGIPAIYTSLSIFGALYEALPFGSILQPITTCAYKVDARPIFDATEPSNITRIGFSSDDLAYSRWRSEIHAGNMPVTDRLADRLIHEGYAGMLVRSFAPLAADSDLNMVLSEFGSNSNTQNTLINYEDRLQALRCSIGSSQSQDI